MPQINRVKGISIPIQFYHTLFHESITRYNTKRFEILHGILILLLKYFCLGKINFPDIALILGSAKKAVPYILGVKKLPSTPESQFMGAQTSLTNAISYARYNLVCFVVYRDNYLFGK